VLYLVSKEEKLRMLAKALRLEINTEGFYTEIVKKTEDEKINEYLSQLVRETKEHAAKISSLIEGLKLE
jgi:rubrerythrin